MTPPKKSFSVLRKESFRVSPAILAGIPRAGNVEDELKRLGGLYEKVENWKAFVVGAGRLVTGQNPASSRPGAEATLRILV
jgi:putative intracellular protease/amidase